MSTTTDTQPQGETLLPCPLCGSTDLFLRDVAGWELDCRGCELSLVLADDPSREGLVRRWNTRAATASPTPAESFVENVTGDYACDAQPNCGWHSSGFSRPLSRGTKVGCLNCKGDARFIGVAARAERARVEGEQWRQGMRDAAKEICDACADEYRYGRARKIEGSTRWWHGEHADFQCEAGSIWHALAERTVNAADPADNDAESLRRAGLPSPAQQALQIVTAWRAVVGGDDLLIHYIKQAIEENRVETSKGDR